MQHGRMALAVVVLAGCSTKVSSYVAKHRPQIDAFRTHLTQIRDAVGAASAPVDDPACKPPVALSRLDQGGNTLPAMYSALASLDKPGSSHEDSHESAFRGQPEDNADLSLLWHWSATPPARADDKLRDSLQASWDRLLAAKYVVVGRAWPVQPPAAGVVGIYLADLSTGAIVCTGRVENKPASDPSKAGEQVDLVNTATGEHTATGVRYGGYTNEMREGLVNASKQLVEKRWGLRL